MESIVENAVGGVISNQANGVIGMIVSRLKKEIRLARGFKQELVELQREFTQLSMIVASASSGNNPLIANWLNRVREVGEEANDLLDEWSYEVLRRQSLRSVVRRYMIMTFKYPITRMRMGHKLRNLTNTINSKVYAEATRLGIRPAQLCNPDDGAAASTYQDPETAALFNHRQSVDYEFMVGRDEDVNQLVGRLCHPENYSTHLTVVGIVGMAGLGKTALAKRISTEQDVTAFFNSPIIWLSVSRSFSLNHGLNRMVEQLFQNSSNMEDRQALIYMLQEKLKGKRYLLILDDVWDTSSTWWESLILVLKEIGGSKGSAVVITSRDKRVVQGPNVHVHQLEGLSEENGWDLFMKRMPNNNVDIPANGEKEKIARKMLKKCGGVPLAIRALSGLLIRDLSIAKWREVEESDLWRKKEDEFGILPSLKLSFNYLPSSSLKACFAFCGIFEEDELIIKDKLICMWMAHGWLESDDNDGDDIIMELKGEEYCKVLLNSSLLQEAENDYYGNVEAFKMHDLVWSLARVVSKGECLCLDGEYDGSSQVRHLSLPHSKQELTFASNMKLQTCLYIDYEESNFNFLLRCRHLRVLSIGEIEGDDYYSKWEMIGRLKHLRYLEFNINLFEEVEYSKLRPPLIKPYNLQTLWIKNFNRFYFCFDGISDSYSYLFKNGIGDLVNLRHIYYDNSGPNGEFGIPEGLGKLTALQTLPEIDFNSNWGGKVSELGLLNNLRGALRLKNLKWIKGRKDASSICLGDKKQIETVLLSFDDSWSDNEEEQPHQQNEVVEALQPPSNLTNLEIRYYKGTKLPRWLTEEGYPLDNLVSLEFTNCEHAEGDLKIENFQYLRSLIMFDCGKMSISFPKHGFQCCQGLEELFLTSNIKRVSIQLHSFLVDLSPLTKLRELHIEWGGTKSSELVGLGSLPCLTKLKTNQLLPADLDQHSPLCNSLQILELRALLCEDDDTNTTFPVQLQHLVALQHLKMRYYKDETIPEWLGSLTSLSILELRYMKELKHLPSKDTMKRLSNLHTLQVWDCPFLKEDLENHSGEEWFKVNHIPIVRYID